MLRPCIPLSQHTSLYSDILRNTWQPHQAHYTFIILSVCTGQYFIMFLSLASYTFVILSRLHDVNAIIILLSPIIENCAGMLSPFG